ncbi:beta-N-acetylglucosaminidase [Alkalibacillus flavidus]|uniref:Beta-N-acetylglucosaminidase n=1 Tax=Alkalibacillus flavidus TaxID=546021 RepID=A0ABV2KTU5_9BACI
MKFKHTILIALIVSVALIGTTVLAQEWANWTEEPIEVPEEKVWTVTFDQPINPETLNSDYVYVENENTGEKHPTSLDLREEGRVITVTPDEKYDAGETYQLHITDGLKSEKDVALNQNTRQIFTIPDKYEVAQLSDNGDLTVQAEYDTYDAAREQVAEDGSEVIVFGNNTIWAPDGIVHTDGFTIVYDGKELGSSKTYVNTVENGEVELEYIATHPQSIEIKLAGETGYVGHDSANVLPPSQIEGQSVYEVLDRPDENVLTHKVYEDGIYRVYTYGWAPEGLEPGEYQSWDGITFDGQEHKLFNQLDITKETNYTAEDLNNYIKEESGHQNYETFRRAETPPLEGLGDAFIKAQEEYGVNALFLMSLAVHESAWGTSNIAQDKNNLFGLNASDNDPYGNADEFESFEESVMYAGYFIKNGYLNPDDYRYEGPFAGNKTFGLNVRYASDPYWGQKIAGHMYRADKYLGEKDRQLLE